MPFSIKRVAGELFAEKKDVELVYLFGSEARGQSVGSSDVDIAIFLKSMPSAEKRLELRTKISSELSKMLRREVEVVILNGAGCILKYQVIRDGKLMFERHEGAERTFRLATIKEYFDYLPTFNFHYNRLKAGGE